jgi:hypothetical protein
MPDGFSRTQLQYQATIITDKGAQAGTSMMMDEKGANAEAIRSQTAGGHA